MTTAAQFRSPDRAGTGMDTADCTLFATIMTITTTRKRGGSG
jgi:hypothetical protein